MTRWVLLMLILMAMLIVPLWIKKGNDNKEKERAAAEAKAEGTASGTQVAPGAQGANGAQVTVTAPVDAPAARQIGFGLTFAQGPAAPDTPAGISHLTCHGEPKPTDRPHKDSCNPYQGDTSCRVVLPVLCMKPGDGGSTDMAPSTLAATAPVMGALLASEAAGTARCEKELGTGWRMADFHAGGGWNMHGKTGSGLATSSSTRYWVAISDKPGNCWDSAP